MSNLTTDLFVDTLLNRYNESVTAISDLIRNIQGASSEAIYCVFDTSGKVGRDFDKSLTALKRIYWREVYNRSNLKSYISTKKHNEIDTYLYGNDFPPFTLENIETQLIEWRSELGEMFKQKVDECFRKLSGDHVTNKPMGFTKKIIYKGLVDSKWASGFNTYMFHDRGVDVVHDLRTAIQTLYKLPISERYDTVYVLKQINSRNEYQEFDGGAFKIKVFMNGNAHIEIHPDVALSLNMVLHSIYPNAIPPKHREKHKDIKEYTFDYRMLSTKTIQSLAEFFNECGSTNFRYEYITYAWKFYKVSDEAKKILEFFGGEYIKIDHEDKKKIKEGYRFGYDVTNVIREAMTNGIVDYKSNQFYPTPKEIVGDMVSELSKHNRQSAWDILEPSAGMGNIASTMRVFGNVECIEKEPLFSKVLEAKGLKTACADFMKVNDNRKYDVVVMNPPYGNQQWQDHIEKAAKHKLKENGFILAVLPADKLVFIEILLGDKFKVDLLNTYDNMFDNTQISTSLYKIEVK